MAERLELEIAVDEALRRLRRIDDALAKNERTVRQTSTSYAGMGRALKAAYQVIAVGVVAQASRELFRLGTAAEETGSKFRTVMGPALDDANAFLDDFAVQAGLSRVAAQNLTATTAAIAQGMGFAQDASAGFAEEVIRLAADVGSFNNLPTEDVLNRVNAALTGERESLKRLGIVINETEVQQRALNDTGKASAALLTQQEKATATLALITEKAGVAVGDLARTQDSAANTARRVQARFADLQNEVATAVLPIFAQLLGTLDDSAGAFDVLGDAIGGVGRFIRTGIAEVQILGSKLAVLASAVEIVGAAFTDMTIEEAVRNFRNMQQAARETEEEILLALNASEGLATSSQSAARAQVQLAGGAQQSAAALEAAAKAEMERLEAIVELVELRAEEAGELGIVADRLAEINRLQERGVSDARDRLALVREEIRLREALLGRIGTPTGGIAGAPGLAGGIGTTPLTANNAGIAAATAELAALNARAREAAEGTRDLSGAVIASVEGIAALDRAVQFLPDSLRGVVSGLSDVIRGAQTAQNSAGSIAQQIAGGAGIVGGIVSIGIGLLNASDEAREKAQQAREQLQRSIQDFISPLQGFQTDIQRAAEALDQIAGGTAFRANYARTLGSATEALDFLAREAARLGDTRAGEVVQALADRLNAAREAFAGELELRRVAAEFGDEAANRLRIQIELERALAEARRLGIDEAVVREAFAAEERRRIREEQARAEEEYARAQREAAQAAEEAARAQEEAARLAAEAAARIEEGNRALSDEIALRGLLLDGKNEEADLLRQEIRFREELARAIEAGLDPELIEQLREIQRRERESAQDAEAVDRLIRSVGGAPGSGPAEVRASVFSGALYADTLTDLTRSSNTYLRQIAENTANGGAGGSRTVVTQNFNGPITLDASFLRSSGGSRLLDAINRGLGAQQQDDALLTSGGVLR